MEEMGATDAVGEIRGEFDEAELGDERLRLRLLMLASSLEEAPEKSIPTAVGTVAGREAAYRFLGNRRVTMEAILATHVRRTAERCRGAGTVYVVSDTTEFGFVGREGLGRVEGTKRGFFGHFALALSGDGRRAPLGVLGIETIVRADEKKAHRNIYASKKDPKRESLRWGRMVERTSSELGDVPAIHVMDAEADIYELLTDLVAKNRRFIIRSGQDRLVADGHLRAGWEGAPVLLSREVRLSRRPVQKGRRNPPREGRLAQLQATVKRVAFQRPKTCTVAFPATLETHVVRVCESAPPDGEQPVEWLLLTSEPVDTDEQVAAVIDGYRARWTIEEFFKALKTGCAYETRQLESIRTLTNLLAVCSVIAWKLLALRTLHRDAPETPATDLVPPILIEALAARLKRRGERRALPSAPTVADLLNGIARLGGHIASNGPPGWQVLWRGYQDLAIWADGFKAARSITYRDQS
jgi:hypothetical protein